MSSPENAAQSNPSAAAGSMAELPKTYTPADHEPRIRARWEASKAWHPTPSNVTSGKARPYAIFIPPPNVTAALHLGHALNNTLQDVLTRAHRMRGFETLWMPGTDHAGIATQAVVEKRVAKDENKRRKDFTREAFVAKIQAFKDEYEATITGQLKAMGCSCDWDRQRFTMDPQCVSAVYEAFFRLFRDGLIYRGKRLVNWDPALQTAVADDECYDEEVDTSFWYLRYPLVQPARAGLTFRHLESKGKLGGDDARPVTWGELARRGYPGAEAHPADAQATITVATTRPETYFGDTAVAINPHDPRAAALAGFFVELPLVGRVIPIVKDDYVVLPKAIALQLGRTEDAADAKAEFASGFLKVTPAHDTNDYELGRRHDLPVINVMAPDASISDKHGWSDIGDAGMFVGKKRDEARKMVVKEFDARGLVESIRPYRHSVKHSDRSKAVVEPYLSDQWYVKVTDPRLAAAANAALVKDQRSHPQHNGHTAHGAAPGDGKLRFIPARYAKSYESWHDNIRDWCISRQLWWGHQIPVWSRTFTPASQQSFVAMLTEAASAAPVLANLGFWSDDKVAVAHGDQPAPATLKGVIDASLAALSSGKPLYICVRDPAGAEAIGAYLEKHGFTRDEDVLDTWFSSALWPLSTLGWPNPQAFAGNAGLLEAFNPSSVLCTAREIITLWVSRMVMFNRYFLGQDSGHGGGRGRLPFSDVLVHAVIQDEKGRKMSKSLGNGVDPLDIIDSHGSDAMRYTLAAMATQTQDLRLPVSKDSRTGKNSSPKFDAGRNFCNKLWNAARFTLQILEKAGPSGGERVERSELTEVDRWMLSRLCAATEAVNAALANYEYADYATAMYDLLWRDFCDWYLECIKPTVATSPAQQAVLAHALEVIIRLLHPIAPFVTEAIYERTRQIRTRPVSGITLGDARTGELLATAHWPEVNGTLRDPAAESHFKFAQELASTINNARATSAVQPKRKITLHAPAPMIAQLGDLQPVVMIMCQLEAITSAPADASKPAATLNFASSELKLSNLADEAVTLDTGAEKERLTKLIAEKRKSAGVIEARLANPGYADKAPAKLVEQSKAELARLTAEAAAAEASLAKLG
jgi:valyl-tRNA synthetase